MDPDARAAWRDKYRREPRPWRGIARLGEVERALRGLPAGARVLELGAGGGKTLHTLAHLGLDPIALDWAREGLPARGVEGDARALPFRDGVFQCVLAVHVLEHLDAAGAQRLATEAERVLAPGGIVGIRVFERGDLRAPPTGFEVRDGGIPYRYYREDEVRSTFTGLAVRDLRVDRIEVRHRGERYERRIVGAVFGRPAKPFSPPGR